VRREARPRLAEVVERRVLGHAVDHVPLEALAQLRAEEQFAAVQSCYKLF
jgi:hypothetical protein